MKTKTITKIISNIEDQRFGFWDEGKEEFTELNSKTLDELSKKMNCGTKLLVSLDIFTEGIKELVRSDLTDIWKRIDFLERKVNLLEKKSKRRCRERND